MRCWPYSKQIQQQQQLSLRQSTSSWRLGEACVFDRRPPIPSYLPVLPSCHSSSHLRFFCTGRVAGSTQCALPKHDRGLPKFAGGQIAAKRLQHTQAQEIDDAPCEDELNTILQVPRTHEASDLQDAVESPEFNEKAYTIIQTLRNAEYKPSERLFNVIENTWPDVTPTVVVHNTGNEQGDGKQNYTEQVLHAQVTNEQYDIYVSGTVPVSEYSDGSLKPILEALVQRYNLQLVSILETDQTAVNDIKAYIPAKLRYILGYEDLKFDKNPVQSTEDSSGNPQLFTAQAYSGSNALGQAQTWTDHETLERLARANAHLDLIRRARQAKVDEFCVKRGGTTTKASKKRQWEIPKVKNAGKPRVYNTSISQECLSSILYTLHKLRSAGLPERIELAPFEPTWHQSSLAPINKPDWNVVSQRLQAKLHKLRKSASFRALERQRKTLPIRNFKTSARICDMIDNNDVVVLVAETGSGKTSQVPQLLFEKAILAGRGSSCNILCTQPRRLAATSVAARVKAECGESLGDSVGHHVRFDRQIPRQEGSITYLTAGVLLKRLQDESDSLLTFTSHIIIDEVHERDVTVDLLLAFLRDLIHRRLSKHQQCPKLVLMSATMRTMEFENYFTQSQGNGKPCVASLTIPGRAYSVTPHMLDDIVPDLINRYAQVPLMMSLLRESHRFLELEDAFALRQYVLMTKQLSAGDEITMDQDAASTTLSDSIRHPAEATVPSQLITATIAHAMTVDDDGDVLVFLPGMQEITMLAHKLESMTVLGNDFNNREKFRIFKLHSAFYETNSMVFDPVPQGCRRIILATSIAQTSITLPNVVHVIDCGRQRGKAYDVIEKRHDLSGFWIDQATSAQRRGRAGRVRDGHYWAMFTHARFETMAEEVRPAMLQSDLTQPSLVLKSHSNSIDLADFFNHTLDAPDSSAVAACTRELNETGMLTADGKITPLGKFCAELPLHPAEARSLLLGVLFGCLQPMLMTVCHDFKRPPITASAVEEKNGLMLRFADVSEDDRLGFVRSFEEYDLAVQSRVNSSVSELEGQSPIRQYYRDMLNVARQLLGILGEYGFLDAASLSRLERTDDVFGLVPEAYNVNSKLTGLYKALALSLVHANLAVWDEDEQAWLAKDTICMLRPFSVNTKDALELLGKKHLRMAGEVVGFREMYRNVLSTPRPFLSETSVVTPLMAMLFGGPIAVIDDHTIEINGWLRYKVDIAPTPNKSDSTLVDLESPALIIFELRKAIDRFLILAYSDLRNWSRLSPDTRAVPPSKRNRLFKSDNKLRQILEHGLIQIVQTDVEHWDVVTHGLTDEGYESVS